MGDSYICWRIFSLLFVDKLIRLSYQYTIHANMVGVFIRFNIPGNNQLVQHFCAKINVFSIQFSIYSIQIFHTENKNKLHAIYIWKKQCGSIIQAAFVKIGNGTDAVMQIEWQMCVAYMCARDWVCVYCIFAYMQVNITEKLILLSAWTKLSTNVPDIVRACQTLHIIIFPTLLRRFTLVSVCFRLAFATMVTIQMFSRKPRIAMRNKWQTTTTITVTAASVTAAAEAAITSHITYNEPNPWAMRVKNVSLKETGKTVRTHCNEN